MPQSFLIFDFGTNEEAAQQARHRLEAWKQALRLGDRLKFKFERQQAETSAEPAKAAAAEPENPEKKKKKTAKTAKTAKGSKTAKAKGRKKKDAEEAPAAPQESAKDKLRVLVRLEFSDHEKLTYQRWLDRIPAEVPFHDAGKQVIRRGQDRFEETADLFDDLD